MNLQISIIGVVLVLPLYGLAFLGLRFLWRRMGASPARWALLLLVPLVLALPFADEFWIAWHFEQACKEAGVKVYRKVEVEGYLDAAALSTRYRDTPSNPTKISKEGTTPEQWKKQMRDYRYWEQLLSDGSAWHVERDDDGIYGYVVDRPKARYHYRYADPRQWVPAGFQMNRREMQVVDSQTGEVLGRELSFERFPGLIDGLWIRFLGSGQVICDRPLDDHAHKVQTGAAYSYVLIPKKIN